uniref:C-type lectin domain-containing protein n=1 Tax=Acrobeloides nanus TaxID=290746 RepID=A0A914C023_9BILA
MNPGASWMDGTPFDFAAWAPNEPANSGGSDNCVATYPSTNTFFGGVFAEKWNDIDCSFVVAGFVCKASATQTCA